MLVAGARLDIIQTLSLDQAIVCLQQSYGLSDEPTTIIRDRAANPVNEPASLPAHSAGRSKLGKD